MRFNRRKRGLRSSERANGALGAKKRMIRDRAAWRHCFLPAAPGTSGIGVAIELASRILGVVDDHFLARPLSGAMVGIRYSNFRGELRGRERGGGVPRPKFSSTSLLASGWMQPKQTFTQPKLVSEEKSTYYFLLHAVIMSWKQYNSPFARAITFWL